MRPPSSTTSGTRCAARSPCWRTSRSATSAPPLSTECDASTRWISMSLSNLSAPSPTAKIGTDFARSDSSSSPIGARELSAPSLSTTSPDSGTASSSWRACSIAVPTCVSPASNVRSGDAVDALRARREAEQPDDEFLAQRLEERAVRAAERVLDPVAARLAVAIGDAHAARVVDQHADVVALRHRRRQQQHRPEQADHQHDERGHAQARPAPSGRAASSCRARRRSSAPRARRSPPPASSSITTENGAPNAKLPFANSVGLYLNRNWKIPSNQCVMDREAIG